MRFIIIGVLIKFAVSLNAQDYSVRNFGWYLPAEDVIINGVGAGIVLNGGNHVQFNNQPLTIVNGLCIELIGFGSILPLAPGSPIYPSRDTSYSIKEVQNTFYRVNTEDDTLFLVKTRLDTTTIIYDVDKEISSYQSPDYLVNGLVISGFGVAGQSVQVNGVNLSGLFTFTAKTNGFSASLIFNITGISNGLSISGLGNNSLQTNGLQIGLFNQCWKLRGVQIGLWNKNEKRSLPLINWNFK